MDVWLIVSCVILLFIEQELQMNELKIKFCLDEAIEKREHMLDIFQRLSEENDGIVTNKMIEKNGGKYMLYYSKYINQLNLFDNCISVIRLSKENWRVKVHYKNIREKGIYSIFLKMRNDFTSNPELYNLKRIEIAERYNISTDAVKTFMGYISFASDKKKMITH